MSPFRDSRRARRAAASLLLSASLALSCGSGPPPRPSVVLVSIDTARADHLGLYGYGRDTSPRIDSLAAEGLVFEQAVTVSENTLVSHASLLTGLYPAAHGAGAADEDIPLGAAYTTLAEDFRSAGYRTAGFTAHGDWLNRRFGFDQGFDAFTSAYRSADEVLAEAEAWLASRDGEAPFFLFVHLYDPHSDWVARPYDAPPPYRGRYTGSDEGDRASWEGRTPAASHFLIAVTKGEISVTDEEIGRIRDQYDEGLAYTDDRLGRFLRFCRDGADPLLVITADHGEEFYEHGAMLHTTLHEPVVRVPLLLLPPRSWGDELGRPRRLAEQVRIVDLRPTLCALAGLPSPEDCQGVDLGPWLRDPGSPCPSGPAPLYHRALRHEGFKLMKEGASWRLFDLRADPEERHDLSERPEYRNRVEEMAALLEAQKILDGEIRTRYVRAGGSEAMPADSEAIERLRALGYVR